ncbi:Exosome complex component Rrp42 [Candidatus Tiddalikarchaeum anstoanum]|nr:Exosome complex component Rrp42 [Candidatus Tiddalikarchaeum anstoanum]
MKKELREYILALADKKLRNRDRRMNDYRPISVETDVSKNAEGSALLRIGDTQVIAGVKMSVGTPYPDTPNSGNLVCNVELSAISDVKFEPGPPTEDAIELSRVVDRGIRESGAIDIDKLCIIPGEKVWNVFVDVYILNNDGNLIDACGLAAISALKNAKMPKLDAKNQVVLGEWSNGKIPFIKVPIPTTFVKIDDTLLIDPDSDEEQISDARLTITCSEGEINAMQKGGKGGFNVKEIEQCVEESFKIRDKISEIIKNLK